jgi:hypothetical protein
VTNFFIKICPKKGVSRKFMQDTKQKISEASHTSSEELMDRWVLREAPASVDLFTCLDPRVEATLLTGAFGDFTTRSASCKEGSSAAIVSAEGAVAASLFGSSLLLQIKQKARDFT